jgi:hypothetical protein
MEKFLEGKLILISNSFHPYFILHFWSKERYISNQSKFRGFRIRLNQWISLNPFQTPPPGTVLAGPACQCCHPRLTVRGHCWPPCAADHRARGPLSSFSLCHGPPFNTAYASASLAPATGDPLLLTGLRPPSPSLLRTDTAGPHLHRHRPLELSPRRRMPLSRDFTTSVLHRRSGELRPNRIARRPPYGPRELTDSTLPPASHHRAAGERVTPPSRAVT